MDKLMIQIFRSVAPRRLVKISEDSFVFLFRIKHFLVLLDPEEWTL